MKSKEACEAQAVQAAQTKSFLQKALDAATKQLDQIEGLMKEINQTQAPKAMAELTVRINSGQAKIQNEATRLQMFQMMDKVNQKMLATQRAQTRAEAAKNYDNKTF